MSTKSKAQSGACKGGSCKSKPNKEVKNECGCKPGKECIENSKKPCFRGVDVANKAIEEIEGGECRDSESEKEAAEFIEACGKAGKDPVKVVKFIADREKMDLSENIEVSEKAEPNYRFALRSLLIAVLKKVLADAAAESGGAFLKVLRDYIFDKLGVVFQTRECDCSRDCGNGGFVQSTKEARGGCEDANENFLVRRIGRDWYVMSI